MIPFHKLYHNLYDMQCKLMKDTHRITNAQANCCSVVQRSCTIFVAIFTSSELFVINVQSTPIDSFDPKIILSVCMNILQDTFIARLNNEFLAEGLHITWIRFIVYTATLEIWWRLYYWRKKFVLTTNILFGACSLRLSRRRICCR